jgi:hypothetical protein
VISFQQHPIGIPINQHPWDHDGEISDGPENDYG